MKVLKGLALGLLGFFFYICLSTFGMVYMLNGTLLNPAFMVAEVNKLDIPAIIKDSGIAGDLVKQQLPLPPEMSKIVTPFVDNAIDDLKPWIDQQINTAIYSTYDYLLGKTPDFKITFQTGQAKEGILNSIRKTATQSPPPELQQLPLQTREQLVKVVEPLVSAKIPATFTVDSNRVGPEVVSMLQQAKDIFGYVKMAYTWLIIATIIFALGIILVHHQVKSASRDLGIAFLTCGVINLAGFFLLNYFVPTQLPKTGISPQLDAWIPQFTSDLMAPLQSFSIVLLIIGAVLLVVSFVYRSSTSQSAE